MFLINSFVPNAPFLYSLKTSENRKAFWCFQGVEKGCIGSKWVRIEYDKTIAIAKISNMHFSSRYTSNCL